MNKKICGIIFILFYHISIVFSQDCGILKNPINPKELEIYGKCYIKNDKFITKFSVPDEMKTKFPGLVYLLLTSKSISELKEKQSWFDLYPLMNKDQIEKLYDILIRENDKLAEIEEKYSQKQNEIKEKYEGIFNIDNRPIPKIPNTDNNVFEHLIQHKDSLKNYQFSFLGTSESESLEVPKIYKFNFMTDSLILLDNSSKKIYYKDFNIFIPKESESYNYSSAIDEYIQNIFCLKVEDNYKNLKDLYLSILPNYAASFWDYGLSYYQKNNGFYQIAQLLKFQQISENSLLKEKYYWGVKSYNINIKNYDDAYNANFELLKTQKMTDLNYFISQLYWSTIYQMNDCNGCCEDLNNILINTIEKDGLDVLKNRTVIQSELIFLDFVKLFNTDKRIVELAKSIEQRMLSIYNIDNDDNFYNSWYYFATKCYFSNLFPKIETFYAIKQEASSKADSCKYKGDKESVLFEYYCYYLLYAYKNGWINKANLDNYSKLIAEANKMGAFQIVAKNL